MAQMDIFKHTILPLWNYTIFPRTNRN
jgi:hypothetical protein